MPSESLIAEIENMMSEIVRLGGENERTQIVPNLTVQDSAPAGLDGFIIVSDDRDGDNILAKKVGSVVYSDNDLVNVMFVEGSEAIAFQQGSESPNNGIWEIVPSTSTDIYYNKGDVGIGKSVAPDATLEILDTSQSQLRLTHTEDTKFVDFTLDTNHDLTVTPSSTGQVIFQPTTDSTDFFQVLDADGGAPILNVDSTNEGVGVGSPTVTYVLEGGTTTAKLFVDTPDTAGVQTFAFLRDSDTRSSTGNFLRSRAGSTAVQSGDRIAQFSFAGHDGTDFVQAAGIQAFVDGAVSANTVPMRLVFITTETSAPGQRMRISSDGDIKIGLGQPSAQLHVDQAADDAAQPVLYLDQADLSEEMIQFETTIGVGNPIEAVGAKTLTVTHFIRVTLPGGLSRYIEAGTIA